ncbi:hypothetical protein E3N88_33755 [Mikania micrantha]|uniref:Uncharacterized protein n=1 Tax=Mikania micrantha TaxID=192012 RepID=A0A5N6MCB4_9ASTR|nr:hypothetical protein E3N88_33755 [Mikania micrantha]
MFRLICQSTRPHESRGARRITLGTSNTVSPRDDETHAFEVSHTSQDELIRPNDHELLVEFRHTNGSMVNQTSDTSGQVLVQENRNSTNTRVKMGSEDQVKGDGGLEKETRKTNLTIVDGEKLAGRRHHLLNVASNINEKADAFIRSRKEAMKITNDV